MYTAYEMKGHFTQLNSLMGTLLSKHDDGNTHNGKIIELRNIM